MYPSQRGRANRKSFEVEVANADSILKDVTRVHYQGPVQLYTRRLWPFLRMSLEGTLPRSCTTLRETIMAILKDVTRVHYQGPVEFYIVCKHI
jgi:hypothetical protein